MKNTANPILHTGSGVFFGPGHCSVVNFTSVSESVKVGEGVGEGVSDGVGVETPWVMVHHAWSHKVSGRNVLMYRMTWTSDGWPVVSSPTVGPFPIPRS